MPAPAAAAAITVAAIASAVALGFVFTKFVYEPHLAPKLEQWAEEFLATRKARRRQRAGAVPVPAVPRESRDTESDESQLIQLENMSCRDVREWRSEVDLSQTPDRNPAVLTSPTHVIADSATPSPTIDPSPSLRQVDSSATLPSPPPNYSKGPALLPTPSPSSALSPAAPQRTVHGSIPSLSQSFPLQLDQEHGIELLSAPSSRPDSPFSALSQPLSPSIHSNLSSSHYYSFSSPNALPPDNVRSPTARPSSRGLSDLDFLSDLSSDNDVLSPPWSDTRVLPQETRRFDDGSSDSSWTSAGARSR